MNVHPDIAPFKSNQKGHNTTSISSKLETIHLSNCVDVYVYSAEGTVGSVLYPKVAQFSQSSLQHSPCFHFIQDPHLSCPCKDSDLVS